LKLIVVLVCLGGFSACNKWVDVTPKDRLTDKTLFSTKEGYMRALNGIYAELNNPALYGRDLTMSMLDVMAQYYNTAASDHIYHLYSSFQYTEDVVKSKLNTIWSRLYTLIANTNVVIERSNDNPEVLPGEYLGLVKGEALALRAMFHFDLLRMFGPIYKDGKDIESIPY